MPGPDMIVNSRKGGTTCEPEGIEVVSQNGHLSLVFGVASGKKGKRTYEMWGYPLNFKAG